MNNQDEIVIILAEKLKDVLNEDEFFEIVRYIYEKYDYAIIPMFAGE